MISIIKKIKAHLRYRLAVQRAEKAHDVDNCRYYVMPSTERGKLLIMSRKSFRKLKLKHYINSSCRMTDVERICFYFTADKAGKSMHPLLKTKGYKRFISWFLTKEKGKND